jgi:hypothetical protein
VYIVLYLFNWVENNTENSFPVYLELQREYFAYS